MNTLTTTNIGRIRRLGRLAILALCIAPCLASAADQKAGKILITTNPASSLGSVSNGTVKFESGTKIQWADGTVLSNTPTVTGGLLTVTPTLQFGLTTQAVADAIIGYWPNLDTNGTGGGGGGTTVTNIIGTNQFITTGFNVQMGTNLVLRWVGGTNLFIDFVNDSGFVTSTITNGVNTRISDLISSLGTAAYSNATAFLPSSYPVLTNVADTSDIDLTASAGVVSGVLSNTGVSSGTYSNAVVQVDAKGRVIVISTGGTPLYSYTETDPIFGSWSNNFHARAANALTNLVNAFGVGGGIGTNLVYSFTPTNASVGLYNGGTNTSGIVSVLYGTNDQTGGVGSTNYVLLADGSDLITMSNDVDNTALSVFDAAGTPLIQFSGSFYENLAIGNGATVGAAGVSIGRESTGGDGVTLGYSASSSDGSVVIGYNAGANDFAVAIGEDATASGPAFSGNIAIGTGDAASGDSRPASASGLHSIALGMESSVEAGTNNTALGYWSRVSGEIANAVQLGLGTNTTTGTLQFRHFQLLDANGIVPVPRYHANVATNFSFINDFGHGYDASTRTVHGTNFALAVASSNAAAGELFLTTNGATITIHSGTNDQTGGSSIAFDGLQPAFLGTDLQPKAISNFWGRIEQFIDSTIVAGGAGFGTAYTNSVQIGDLLVTIPRDALRTNGNIDATWLSIDYFLVGNNTNTFIDLFLYAQQRGADRSITNSLLVYTNVTSFGAVALNVPTNFAIAQSSLISTNLLDHKLRIRSRSIASSPLTNNGVVFIGGAKGF